MKRSTLIHILIIFTLLAGWVGALPAQAQPQDTFVVSIEVDDAWAHDSNPGNGTCQDQISRGCTLRAAIEEANARAGADMIQFANTNMNITLDTSVGALPDITGALTIDASTVWNTVNDQPGVTLNCNGGGFAGLRFESSANYSSVYGLFVTNCQNGMYVYSAHNTFGSPSPGGRNVFSDNTICGLVLMGSDAYDTVVVANWIGLGLDGSSAAPNECGVYLGSGAHDNVLSTNYISGNTLEGVWIIDSDTINNILIKNRIGLGADDTTAVGNGLYGISVSTSSPQIIGSFGSGNLIANNGHNGIHFMAGGSTIVDNIITNNQGEGIWVSGTSNGIAYNTISGNSGNGIQVNGGSYNGISANSIFANTGLGIDLINGGNNELSAPVITSGDASGASGTTCANCMVQIFSDTQDEGEIYHGDATADGSGNWSYVGALSGPHVTATTLDTYGNTSEFSAPYDISGGSNQPPYTPGCPGPIDGDTQISLHPTLTWCGDDPDGDAVTYTVMGGPQGQAWAQWCSSTPNPSCAPGTLLPNTTYQWKVIANDGINEAVHGPVWSFTTQSSGNPTNTTYLPMVKR